MFHEILKQIAQQGARGNNLPKATPKILQEVWPAMVGTQIAKMSSPIRLQERTLYIAARHQNLVDDWKHSPLPLLRRLRRFSPWPIETLEIEYDPTAGVSDEASAPTSPPVTPASTADVDAETDSAIDAELRSLIDQIDSHRKMHDRSRDDQD